MRLQVSTQRLPLDVFFSSSIIPTIVWPIKAFFAQKSCGLLQEINIDWLVNLFTFLLLEHTFLIHKSRATVIWQIWTESRQASSFHCNYDFSKQKERHRLKERNLKDGVIQVVQSTDGIVQFGWHLYSFPILSYAESALLTKSANCIFLKKVEDTQFYSFSLYKRQRGWHPQPWGNALVWFRKACSDWTMIEAPQWQILWQPVRLLQSSWCVVHGYFFAVGKMPRKGGSLTKDMVIYSQMKPK